MELLGRGIDVMEVECSRMLRKTADPATAASLVDKHALHLPSTLRDRTGIALRTPIPTLRSSIERRIAMLRTAEVCPPKPSFTCAISFPFANAPCSLQAQSTQPIAHCRIADAELRGNDALYTEMLSPRLARCGLCARPGRRVPGSGRRAARSRRPRRRRRSGTRGGAAPAGGS